jgi:hypothetical protein
MPADPTDGLFHCPECDRGYHTMVDLNKHIKLHEEPIPSFGDFGLSDDN